MNKIKSNESVNNIFKKSWETLHRVYRDGDINTEEYIKEHSKLVYKTSLMID